MGSNTFHLEHLRVEDGRVTATLLDEKRSVRLGDSVFRSGGIDQATWTAGVDAFERLLTRCQTDGVRHLCVVATSAMRRASNGQEFLEALARRFGVSVELLPPETEARLAYLGARSALQGAESARAAVIDVGGGSAELTVGVGGQILLTESLPLGVLRVRHELQTLLSADDAADSGGGCRYGHLVECIKARHRDVFTAAAGLSADTVALASGTARAVRKLAMRESAQPGKTGLLSTAAMREALVRYGALRPAALQALGVDPARADTILLAVSVLLALVEGLGASTALVVGGGLRHGLAVREADRIVCGDVVDSRTAVRPVDGTSLALAVAS